MHDQLKPAIAISFMLLFFGCSGGGGTETDAADVVKTDILEDFFETAGEENADAQEVAADVLEETQQEIQVVETQDAGKETAEDTGTKDSGSYHPSGWTDPKSGNFHGDATKKGLGMCKDCHGAALDGGSAGVSCNSCHSGWKTNCTFCHGGKDNNLGAPPVDTKDQFDTTHTSVGAHTSHVTAKSKLSSPLDCVKCHVKPVDALSDGHIDPSPAEVDFAAWNHDTAICSNLYCHGNFVGGNNANAPKWTVVNGTKAACGTCHDLPPKTGKHPSNFGKHSFMGKNCSNCHNGFANDGATQILQPDKHLNGAKDVSIKNGTWTASTKTCDPACHGAEKW